MLARNKLFILVLIVTSFVAACRPQAQETLELPTEAQLPTITPTPEVTLTLTPTNTLTNTPTLTPTLTPSNTPSNTPPPSATYTPSLTPTASLTFTPSQTATSTATATPEQPVIQTFDANPTTAGPGAIVTLRWVTQADSARLERLNVQGVPTEVFTVAISGTQQVTIPQGAQGQIIYRLVAIRGGNEVARSLPIVVSCPASWFFGNEFAPPDAGCAVATGAIGPGAYQNFERGLMIFIGANNLNRIYGLDRSNGRHINYANNWDGATIVAGSPPSGLFDAQGMFNWAYNNTLAPIGTWNAAIGWAVAPIDQSQRTIQMGQDGSTYIDSPLGVFRLRPDGTWVQIR